MRLPRRLSSLPLPVAGALLALLVLALGISGWALYRQFATPPLPPAVEAVPNTPPLDAPEAGLSVFHLGHSLVGRNMPAMLAQLAASGGFDTHDYHHQLGWGATLRAHYEPEVEIPGFATENDNPRFRSAHEAVASGDYDAIVLTEMVELRDAIRWHDSAGYMHRWTRAIRAGRPDARVFLYETWHPRRDTDAWLARLDADPDALWKGHVLSQVWNDHRAGPVHVIPAGRVLAALTRALAERGGIPGMEDERALFARDEANQIDDIHLNDLGNYLVALVHFAVLYQRAPAGLPHELLRADGSRADAPSPEAAALMQEVTWQVVSALPETGIPAETEREQSP